MYMVDGISNGRIIRESAMSIGGRLRFSRSCPKPQLNQGVTRLIHVEGLDPNDRVSY
jgi:hypothetical protein